MKKNFLVLGIVLGILMISMVSFASAGLFSKGITGKAIWASNHCSAKNPCPAGEGDCDRAIDCLTGYCAQNVGLKYGQMSGMDVCECKSGIWNGNSCASATVTEIPLEIIETSSCTGNSCTIYEGSTGIFQSKKISIEDISSSLVKLKIGDETTNYLREKDNQKLIDGTIVEVKDILLQPSIDSRSRVKIEFTMEGVMDTPLRTIKRGYFPEPFISSGVADVAIIYGTQKGASTLEQVQAGNIQSYLGEYMKNLGNIILSDVEINSVKNKNLILIGTQETCSNSVFKYTSNFKDGCNAGLNQGEFLIETVESPFQTGKTILHIYGYDVASTVHAVNYLTTNKYKLWETVKMGTVTYIETPSCTDSDGKNYYVKGERNSAEGKFTDTCRKNEAISGQNLNVNSGPYLLEGFCEMKNYTTGNKLEIGAEFYKCPNGCYDGACLPEVTENPICTDSDGGNNPYVKGKVIDFSGRIHTDFCSKDYGETNKNQISEYTCQEGGFALQNIIECPNGCSDGACISTPTVTEIPESIRTMLSECKTIVWFDKTGKSKVLKCDSL